MGHQFARPALAAAIALAVGACGGGDGGGDPPPVLDNAREQVAAATPPATDSISSPADSVEDTAPASELPPPDPSVFEGSNRVVNLWVGPDGETTAIDVWGRRTFSNGPLLLAEDVGFGRASDYFSAPPEYHLVVVGAGAGPDGEERASMFNATDGEQITLIFTNGDEFGGVDAPNLIERGPQAPDPPAEGNGLIVLTAPNVGAHSDRLTASVGGDAFFVGDGSDTCRTQRVEAGGFPPDVLGGTQQIELEVPPGSAAISLHPWFSPDECAQPSVLDLTLAVGAGEAVLVVVYTTDGTSLSAVTLPVAGVT